MVQRQRSDSFGDSTGLLIVLPDGSCDLHPTRIGHGLIANAVAVGGQLMDGARALPGVVGVQGRGLLVGIRLDRPAAEVQRALFQHRVLTGTSTDSAVLRLMPPLTFSHDEAGLVLDALREVLT